MDLFCSFSSFGLPFPLEGLEEIAVGIIKVDQPHMIAAPLNRGRYWIAHGSLRAVHGPPLTGRRASGERPSASGGPSVPSVRRTGGHPALRLAGV